MGLAARVGELCYLSLKGGDQSCLCLGGVEVQKGHTFSVGGMQFKRTHNLKVGVLSPIRSGQPTPYYSTGCRLRDFLVIY